MQPFALQLYNMAKPVQFTNKVTPQSSEPSTNNIINASRAFCRFYLNHDSSRYYAKATLRPM